MSNPAPTPLPPDQIREQLRRLLAAERFARSQSLSSFLRYTVEEYLEGRGETLKEYVIALEALGKGNSFDPRIDPIVRVQARKLRDRLEKYYEEEGAADPIIIDYVKGGYAPTFRLRQAVEANAAPAEPEPAPAAPVVVATASPPATAVRKRPVWPVLTAAAALAVAGAIWISIRDRGGPQSPAATPALLRFTFHAGTSTFPALSADGRWVAFASDQGERGNLDIWIQPARGGEAKRLTSHAAADITPDLSPDGTQVVFRSARDGGGLYLVPVLGGPERRIADAGWRPRFSPDGREIAYQGVSARRGGDLFVVASGGGEARKLDIGNDIELGGTPLWSPDGSRLLFLGSDRRRDRSWDWWLVSKDGGAPASAGFAGLLARQGFPAPDAHSIPGDWSGQGVVGSLPRGQSSNLWIFPFDHAARRLSGSARQITFGTAWESLPRLSGNGLLVCASEAQISRLYGLPLHTPRSAPEPVRLTDDLALDPGYFRALTRFSASQRYLLFPSSRSGNLDVFVKDSQSGAESPVTAGAAPEDQPLLAPGDSQVVYRARERNASPLYLARLGTQVSHKVCDDCGEPNSWAGGGRRLLYTARGGLNMLDLETGGKTEIYSERGITLRHAALSPGRRLLAVTVDDPSSRGERAYLTGFSGGPLQSRNQWTEILPDHGVESMHWAADGAGLYFFSTLDDFRCLWLQPLDAEGRPRGEPAAIAHFHGVLRPWSSWLAVTPGRIVFSLTETTSSLWTGQLPAGR